MALPELTLGPLHVHGAHLDRGSIVAHGNAAENDPPALEIVGVGKHVVAQPLELPRRVRGVADHHGGPFGEGSCGRVDLGGRLAVEHNAAACDLNVRHSIFSCPDSDLTLRDPVVLIQQTDTKSRSVRYVGHGNCYHNLTAFWVRSAGKERVVDRFLENFQTGVQEKGGTEDAVPLPTAAGPWVPRRNDPANVPGVCVQRGSSAMRSPVIP